MKCDEVKAMQGAYLDSELDAKTTLEVAVHLRACAECARLFAEEQKLEARLRNGLSRGQRTAALWEQIAHSVVTAAPSAARREPATRHSRSAGWCTVLTALVEPLAAGWRRSCWVWSGLAAVWVVIVGLNLAAREPKTAAARTRLPPASEVRFAVQQKQSLLADLAALSEPPAADKVKTAPPTPRSDRRKEALNT